MDKDSLKSSNHDNTTGNNVNTFSNRTGVDPSLMPRASSEASRQTSSTDFGLQWGNRKRLRCMKVQAKAKTKDDFSSFPAQRTVSRVDRRVVRSERGSPNRPSANTNYSNGYLNLRQRPSSPQRILRNSETGSMRGHNNGGVRGITSPDRAVHDKKGTNINNHHGHNHNENNKSAATSDTAPDSKRGGSSSGSGEAAAQPVWPPKFVIALTNKEKEEDFMAIKGSKLPQRPKKRAKIIQRTLNALEVVGRLFRSLDLTDFWRVFLLVSPGGWLCDLTLERYEVREKKITKKRPRGLKAMGNVDSDSD